MRTGASSKNLKKNSEEDRSGKKKIKSNKRRRDNSLSSYSSDSEDNSRRKKSRREPRKLEKRRKEIKKSEKGKSRKKRYRRSSSVSSMGSDSSLSCSTCYGRSSSSDRSRSPTRRGDRKVRLSPRGMSKGRKRERERGRRSSRYESKDSRYRSRSCSACSGGSSRSSSRRRSPSKEKFREKGESRRLRSVLALTKSSDEMEERYGSRCEDRDKIITAYDDFSFSRSKDSYDAGMKRPVEVGNKGKDYCSTGIEDGAYVEGQEVILSKARTRPAKNSDVGGDDSLACEFGSTKDPSMGKEREVVDDDGSKEADDLESILRQKALENFRKFRGGLSTELGSLDDRKDENVVIISESKTTTSLENQRHVQGGSRPNEFKARPFTDPLSRESIVNFPSEKNNENPMLSHPNDSESSKPGGNHIISSSRVGQLKRVPESLNKMSLEKTSLAKDTQSKTVVAEPGSGKVLGAKVNIADGSASQTPCLNTESGDYKSTKPMVESASGSQFEQKTFSRLHDGEMVQVSYKVYIPKKTPALGRRQLQR